MLATLYSALSDLYQCYQPCTSVVMSLRDIVARDVIPNVMFQIRKYFSEWRKLFCLWFIKCALYLSWHLTFLLSAKTFFKLSTPSIKFFFISYLIFNLRLFYFVLVVLLIIKRTQEYAKSLILIFSKFKSYDLPSISI